MTGIIIAMETEVVDLTKCFKSFITTHIDEKNSLPQLIKTTKR